MKNKKIVFISTIGVLVLILGTFFLFFNTYTISGKVIDLASKEAVEGVGVSVGGIVSITNKEGVFQLKNVKKYQSKILEIKVPMGYEELSPIPVKENVVDILISPTLETMVSRLNNATRNVQHDYLWDYMHPDDQTYWESKEKYSATFKKANDIKTELGLANVVKFTIGKNIRKLDTWTHDITGKKYTNVMEVPVEEKINENESIIQLEYYQKIEGVWRYFTGSKKENYQKFFNTYEEWKKSSSN